MHGPQAAQYGETNDQVNDVISYLKLHYQGVINMVLYYPMIFSGFGTNRLIL
jgi:hypothetical protein